jgi:Fibronectin type III domain
MSVPPPSFAAFAQAAAMTGRVAERDALLQQAQTLTLQIRADRTALESSLTTESIYVDGVVEKLPADAQAAAIKSAGMGVAADTGTPVGPMPKVEGLTASAGDADGEIDLHWNSIRRGLQNYRLELSEDPAGQSGWRFAANSRKSSATIEGLTTGKRYWFRVTAEGAAGPGPASTPATKVAP